MAGVTTAAVAGAMMLMSSWVKSPRSQRAGSVGLAASVRATKLIGSGVSWVKLLRATGVFMDDSLAAVASTGAVLLALNAELGLVDTA